MKYLLTIDPGIAHTGWALFKRRKLIKYGMIETKTKHGTNEERMIIILSELMTLVKPRVDNGVSILIEDFVPYMRQMKFGFKNAMSTSKLIGVLSTIPYICKGAVKLNLVYAIKWQTQLLSGHSLKVKRDKKEFIYKLIVKHVKLKKMKRKLPTHVADAIAMGYYKLKMRVK